MSAMAAVHVAAATRNFMTASLVLDSLHIEASSRSRAETGYTIHADHKKHWLDHDLPLPLLKSLLAEIASVGEIRFQGWGDPLANADILAMPGPKSVVASWGLA